MTREEYLEWLNRPRESSTKKLAEKLARNLGLNDPDEGEDLDFGAGTDWFRVRLERAADLKAIPMRVKHLASEIIADDAILPLKAKGGVPKLSELIVVELWPHKLMACLRAHRKRVEKMWSGRRLIESLENSGYRVTFDE